jgi:hypothetical protein
VIGTAETVLHGRVTPGTVLHRRRPRALGGEANGAWRLCWCLQLCRTVPAVVLAVVLVFATMQGPSPLWSPPVKAGGQPVGRWATPGGPAERHPKRLTVAPPTVPATATSLKLQRATDLCQTDRCPRQPGVSSSPEFGCTLRQTSTRDVSSAPQSVRSSPASSSAAASSPASSSGGGSANAGSERSSQPAPPATTHAAASNQPTNPVRTYDRIARQP